MNLEDVEIETALENFPVTNKMTKDVLTQLFIVQEQVPKREISKRPSYLLDSLFNDAARLVVGNRQASVSDIQRAFSVGYRRGAIIMRQLENAGIVGSQKGASPREVLISDEQKLEKILACAGMKKV